MQHSIVCTPWHYLPSLPMPLSPLSFLSSLLSLPLLYLPLLPFLSSLLPLSSPPSLLSSFLSSLLLSSLLLLPLLYFSSPLLSSPLLSSPLLSSPLLSSPLLSSPLSLSPLLSPLLFLLSLIPLPIFAPSPLPPTSGLSGSGKTHLANQLVSEIGTCVAGPAELIKVNWTMNLSLNILGYSEMQLIDTQ